ncbi:Uncharacterised protein [Klebsiella pneumoniae]|nr:Uncharacterised protein [Klebsiella pneumoniae]SWW19566.1 Uncharacterised protein [Klebsiella pneumoniae]SWW39174.1 Uncharacterised protein [Klebsiella pneumoniae]SWW64154.1 Uncharacterised protein [Klebsiella pneumoniae]
MTKSTITRERLEELAAGQSGFNLRVATYEESQELARIALAAMDGEPVKRVNADQMHHVCLEANRHLDKYGAMAKEVNKLLGCIPAQPAPDYPEVLPCPVLLEPGMRFGKGVKTRLVLDAIQRRAEHYAELEAMTPEERAEYDAGIEAFKAMLPQPAPVVPEEKPIPNTLSMYAVDAVAAIAEVKGWNACRAAMLQAKSLTSINPAPALVSLPKNAKSLTGNSPVNDVTAGKPLTIFLPDISSKAFWSGAGKNETFHPETYRRWAKEAIERGCIIACIDVEVK